MKRNSRSVEMMNRLNFINKAFERGFIAFLPVVDEGIDLILCREAKGDVAEDIRKVQLKARWTISKKYLGRNIWIVFPEDDVWYMAPHDKLVKIAEKLHFAKGSASWEKKGEYSRVKLGKKLKAEMRRFVFPDNNSDGVT